MADVIQDLHDANDLLESQTAIGLDATDVLDSMFMDIVSKVRGIQGLSARDKHTFTMAIGGGPWSPDHKKQLATIVRGEHGEKNVVLAGKRRNQRCHQFENWLEEKSWVYLKDKKNSRIAKSSCLATCMSQCGIELPCEKTLYRGVSILNFCDYKYDTSEDEVKKDMEILQGFVKHHKRGDIPFIVDYPCSPSQLAPELASAMFPKGLPVDVVIPELDGILLGARMRGRRSESSTSWLQNVPSNRRAWVAEQLARESRREHAPRNGPCMSPCNVDQAAARLDDDVQLPVQQRRTVAMLPWSMPTKPIHDNHSYDHKPMVTSGEVPKQEAIDEPEVDKSDHDVGPGATMNSVENMEKSLLAAAALRDKSKGKEKKRATAANASAKKAPTAKQRTLVRMRLWGKQAVKHTTPRRAGGVASAAGKAPAIIAESIDMTDIFENMRKDFHKLSRGAFTTRAYKNGMKRAQRANFAVADCTQFARDQFQQACALWTQLCR